MIFCIGVTSFFDFKLVNTTLLNLLELECAVKLKHCSWGKNDFFNKRTLVEMLLKQGYRANILMFNVFGSSRKDEFVLFSSCFSLQSLQGYRLYNFKHITRTGSLTQSCSDQNQSSDKRLAISVITIHISILLFRKTVPERTHIG